MLQYPVFRAFLLLILILLFGITGFYVTSPEFTFFDALYMTVITLSTVGYGEVTGFSEAGRSFSIVFILVAFVVVALAIRFIVESLLSHWSLNYWKHKKNKIMITKLKDHTIVCGYGRNGRQAVQRLQHHGEKYIVIEQEESLIEAHEKEILFYKETALSDEVLMAAGIARAKNLICSLPDDADNLFVVLSARRLQPDIVIVSRVSEERNQSKLEWAGANHVIMPDKIGGDHMVALLTVPDLIHFLGNLDWWKDETSPNLEEVALRQLPKEYQNKSLKELQVRERTGCNVIGYKDAEGNQHINPDANHSLPADGKLIILGTRKSIKKLNTIFQLD
jgi:voltage-gated potassium channel